MQLKSEALQTFHEKVEKEHLIPLWISAPLIMPAQPKTDAVPYLWRGELLRERLMEAGELLAPGEGGDSMRRVLILENPGLKAKGLMGSTTQTLTAAVQIIFPGEFAPAHRHSQSAFRFIISGQGASTTVQGEKVLMAEGDYLLTDRYCWHEHVHEGEGPMLWMDGLDIPFVKAVNATFFEPHPEEKQKVEFPVDFSRRRYADGMLRPLADRNKRGDPSPLAAYSWKKTINALKSLDELDEVDPFDGIALEYINPANGGPANPYIGNRIQMLRPGQHTKAHRHVHSSVHIVHAGSGYSVINGERFDWSKGDIFVVPTWAWHEHANGSASEPAILFSMNDVPLFEKLQLEAEEPYRENRGYQTVSKIFS